MHSLNLHSTRLHPLRRFIESAQITAISLLILAGIGAPATAATRYTLVGWNNLGMHCMDSDYSVFSILPPYNTVHGQLMVSSGAGAQLVKSGGAYTVTYEAVADPQGSINRTANGKGNFWEYSMPLYGAALMLDQGLPVPGPNSFSMPGVNNVPQAMQFETNFNWFAAYGIPITPYDDDGHPNQYPLMRLVARNSSGNVVASARVVLPVSDEMDCKLCHLSGSSAAARPYSGWVNDPDQGRDYRLNILKLHDDVFLGEARFQEALSALGFHPEGLHATVTKNGRPILCASCHLSEALPGSGRAGIPPLTEAMHAGHARVVDPRNRLTLDSSNNRMACYACHPGSVTRCLRGAMGKAVASDGQMAMQCQNCHGTMTQVGATNRIGWLNEPTCQSCHTGDAVVNGGQIRFTSVFDNSGQERVVTNRRFATQADTPAPGLSLYRFSRGHGGLQCAACHGSTHAEYPSAFPNDNLQSQDLQGHAGTLIECTACHASMPNTISGGPHGMHPLGNNWAQDHADAVENSGGPGQCRSCHGLDYKGTVLSRVQGNRTITTKFGVRNFWSGYQVGCYECHNGPNSSNPSPNTPPTVANATATTTSGVPVHVTVQASDPNGQPFSLRIVAQPAHGTAAYHENRLTYYPETGFAGTDQFTVAASDGFASSALATVSITVTKPDSDADGIPDWWLTQHFGHPEGALADLSRAEDDPDHDGAVNFQEYGAGTDPHRANSTLRLGKMEASGPDLRFTFNTILGQQYAVLAATNVTTGPWLPVTNVWGHPDSVRIVLPLNGGPAERFFRIAVPPAR